MSNCLDLPKRNLIFGCKIQSAIEEIAISDNFETLTHSLGLRLLYLSIQKNLGDGREKEGKKKTYLSRKRKEFR